jgi:hypothetical protein
MDDPHPRACSIHQATLRHWCAQVSDPEDPSRRIPLYALEQRLRAENYRRQQEAGGGTGNASGRVSGEPA